MSGVPLFLSRPNLNLDKSNLWRARGLWWLEVEFQSLFEIGQCFSLVFALARDIQLKALCNVPIAFPPNARRKWTLHGFILSLNSAFGQLGSRTVARATVNWNLAGSCTATGMLIDGGLRRSIVTSTGPGPVGRPGFSEVQKCGEVRAHRGECGDK